jgi:hypothetical protein
MEFFQVVENKFSEPMGGKMAIDETEEIHFVDGWFLFNGSN